MSSWERIKADPERLARYREKQKTYRKNASPEAREKRRLRDKKYRESKKCSEEFKAKERLRWKKRYRESAEYRERHLKQNLEWQKAHRERMYLIKRKSRLKHRERLNEKRRTRYKTDKDFRDRENARRKAWADSHPESKSDRSEYFKAYNRAHRDERRAYLKAWRERKSLERGIVKKTKPAISTILHSRGKKVNSSSLSDTLALAYVMTHKSRKSKKNRKPNLVTKAQKRKYHLTQKLKEMRLKADPTYYAFYREEQRERSRKRRDKNRKRPYVPKLSMRIPDYLPFGVTSHIAASSPLYYHNLTKEQKVSAKNYAMLQAVERRNKQKPR